MELLAWRLSAFLSASAGHSELGILARSLLAGLSTAIAPPDAIYSSQNSPENSCDVLLRRRSPKGGGWCSITLNQSTYAQLQ